MRICGWSVSTRPISFPTEGDNFYMNTGLVTKPNSPYIWTAQKISINIEQKVRLKDKLKQYTVSVYPMDVKNYERAKISGKAMYYDNIMLSNNAKDYIKVIECEYDKVGYRKMKYEKETRKSTIW